MTALRLNALVGTSLFLVATDRGISICLENCGDDKGFDPNQSGTEIVLTHCNGGLRLSVESSADTRSHEHASPPLPTPESTSFDLPALDFGPLNPSACTSTLSGNHTDIYNAIQMPFPSHLTSLSTECPESMNWDFVPPNTSYMHSMWDPLLPEATKPAPDSESSSLPALSPLFIMESFETPPSPSSSATSASSLRTPESGASPDENNEVQRPRKRSINSSPDASFPCREPDCHRVFKREKARIRHEGTHSEIICSFVGCGTVFRRRHDKMRHEYMRHGKASNLCRKCNKTFLSKANLTKHPLQ
ncbi:hypothetical protein DL96DRAFT_1599853 [Flagelloscypha sp. PMI_526]|nr:hypothetical protein DL96DRAFT_1599853 [Flagelloscypha sp. PMI_526]